jgi:FtsZ-binding cell division protein ZapB
MPITRSQSKKVADEHEVLRAELDRLKKENDELREECQRCREEYNDLFNRYQVLHEEHQLILMQQQKNCICESHLIGAMRHIEISQEPEQTPDAVQSQICEHPVWHNVNTSEIDADGVSDSFSFDLICDSCSKILLQGVECISGSWYDIHDKKWAEKYQIDKAYKSSC